MEMIQDLIRLEINKIMSKERKDGNLDITDLRRLFRHSKTMKFLNFKNEKNDDSLLAAPQKKSNKMMMMMLKDGFNSEMNRFISDT